MVMFLKGIGRMTRLMGDAVLIIKMGIILLDNIKMDKEKDLEHIYFQINQKFKEIGKEMTSV